MARNKINDLNDHLFAALERLNDEELTGDQLNEEIERSTAIANVSGKIIESMKIQSNLFIKMTENGYCPNVPEQFKELAQQNKC
jgi:hypothetical protein